jgi:WD40 repeat protein/class 3 adenylate cyclase/GTPase SAR1 family protein
MLELWLELITMSKTEPINSPPQNAGSAKIAQKLPVGVKLLRTLWTNSAIGQMAWSPDGKLLAAPLADGTIRLWDVESGECVRILRGHEDKVYCVTFDPKGGLMASGSSDRTVKVWELASGKVVHTFKGEQEDWFTSVVFHPTEKILACGTPNSVVVRFYETTTGKPCKALERVQPSSGVRAIAFDATGELFAIATVGLGTFVFKFSSRKRLFSFMETGIKYREVYSLAFDATGTVLATTGRDSTVTLWDIRKCKLIRTLEGHTRPVGSVAFSNDSGLLASQSYEMINSVRLWSVETGDCVATIPEGGIGGRDEVFGLAFHPRTPLLATVGINLYNQTARNLNLIHIFELDPQALLSRGVTGPSTHYVNAKVVLLGDTGVGKSGLSLVLNGKPFVATDSTPGRRVWTFQSQKVNIEPNVKQSRETLLWDLAGQPGYRVIHQLHLKEVAVALVVFDARSETDPLAGVRHWDRALRLAQQRQGTSFVPMKKFLVSARTDRGKVSVSKERLDALLEEFGFDGYFETSAKEGWQIKELKQAIQNAIAWDALPKVSSTALFSNIKAFLLKVKETGKLVALEDQLYEEFARTHRAIAKKELNLRDQFATCIGRLENRDLIRRLSFGGYVLLQPELLDAYASAMVNAAKEEPDGLGSIAEEIALAGQFYIPKEQKITDSGQEQLLLHATVEELARHDLALKESAADGRYLVFPSQFNRDYEDAPEPKGKAVALTFDGPVQSLYATLAVRLGHSGLFTTGRTDMWRNAVVFSAKAGGRCGVYLHEFAEARGRLLIFYDQHEEQLPSDETRFHFEEFVLAHAQRHAINGTVDVVRFFVCNNGHPVPEDYVKLLRDQGKDEFVCPCGTRVSLREPKERLQYASKVAAMEQSADRQRNFEMFVESARGETKTPSFISWAGEERVTLAVVFTDVVGSTAMGEELRDDRMNEVRRAHFTRSRQLIEQFNGREIKTIGDSFMAAFRSVEKGLDYARALQANPGHPDVKIRAGVHIGPMQVEDNDVFGGAVNFAARVVGAIEGAEIWLSERAKEDLERAGAKQHSKLKWERHDGVRMKGFAGSFTLWSLTD